MSLRGGQDGVTVPRPPKDTSVAGETAIGRAKGYAGTAGLARPRVSNLKAEGLCDPGAVFGICFDEMRGLTALDFLAGCAEVPGDVCDEAGALALVQHAVEQSGLFEVVGAIRFRVLGAAGRAGERDPDLGRPGIGHRSAAAVGGVVRRRAPVAIDAHHPVPLVVVLLRVRAVDRNLREVRSEPVALGVGIREKTALEQLVWGWLDPGDEARRAEGGLLDLSEEIVWIPVEHQPADRDER